MQHTWTLIGMEWIAAASSKQDYREEGSEPLMDAGERAYRIWEWWRPIVADGTDFPCFSKALQLIGRLLQVSSCAVERVFSVLQRIREVGSDSMLEDMLQVRLFARCNGDIRGLHLKAIEHPLEDVP